MSKGKELWVLVCDSARARLLHGTLTAHGRPHMDEVSKLETTFVEKEHHRPSKLSPGGHSASFGHEHEEKLAHFARELVPWLDKELSARSIGSCSVFAPAHFLGAMRKVLPKLLVAKLVEHEGEITNLSSGQLAEHKKIAALLAG